jgi:transcription initiation factor IIE alpha subunit
VGGCGVNGQLTFPDPTARSTDPDTSHQAAELAKQSAGGHRDLALRVLRANPDGLTDFELAELTGVAQTSIGKRRHDLYRAGLVVKTDLRRPSPSGSPAIVWKVSA